MVADNSTILPVKLQIMHPLQQQKKKKKKNFFFLHKSKIWQNQEKYQ